MIENIDVSDLVGDLSLYGFLTLFLTLFLRSLHSNVFRKEITLGIVKLFRAFFGRDLLSHYLFDAGKLYIETAKNIIFNNSCEQKSELFQALLATKIKVVLRETIKWLTHLLKNINKINSIQLQTEFYQFIRKTTKLYEDEIYEAFFNLVRDEAKAKTLYNIVYLGKTADGLKDDGIGFKTYHERNIQHILDFIDNLHIYISLTKKQLISAFLSEIDTALRTSVRDTEKVFKEKNGRICAIME